MSSAFKVKFSGPNFTYLKSADKDKFFAVSSVEIWGWNGATSNCRERKNYQSIENQSPHTIFQQPYLVRHVCS